MIGRDFPGRGRVAVLSTSPRTALDDYGRLMRMADYDRALPGERETILKLNTSWQTWYPACSTEPWQLEGVVRTLQNDGYRNLIAAQNRTVMVDAYEGERHNKHKDIVDAYGLRNVHLYEPYVRWVRYEPKAPMLVLDRLYPEGVLIPELLIGRNMVHLPTLRTDDSVIVAGAMKSAYDGLLGEERQRVQGVLHEALVDLLSIQKEIHTGLFAVTDGTFAGDGPCPRAMRWHEKNVILASADQVAIDAISATLQGLDPMSIPFICMAHEMGLGVGDPKEIEVAGLDISGEDWQLAREGAPASQSPRRVCPGRPRPFESLLRRLPALPGSHVASNLYHTLYWYPFVGRERVEEALRTPWGQHFQTYGNGKVVVPGVEPRTTAIAAGSTLVAGLLAIRLIRKVLRRKD